MPPYSTAYGGFRRRNVRTSGFMGAFAGTPRRHTAYMGRAGLPARFTAARSRGYPAVGASIRAAAYAAASSAKETKYFDVGINTNVTWAGTDWSGSEVPADNYVNSSGAAAAYTDSALIPSANGSGYGQVDGNKYDLKAIRIRGSLKASVLSDQADMPQAVQVRLLLVEDSQPNGAQAQGEDVLQDIGEAAENLYSFLRIPNGLGRFRIIKDKMVTLQVSAAGTDGASTNSVAFYTSMFKMNAKPNCTVTIKSGNAAPTVAGLINKNYFLLLAGVAGAAASAVTITGASRAYYKD